MFGGKFVLVIRGAIFGGGLIFRILSGPAKSIEMSRRQSPRSSYRQGLPL